MADGFKAFDPNAEVIGRSMMSNFMNQHQENFVPVLNKYGIEAIDPEGWYSQQKWLDILKEVTETSGDAIFDLVAVGMSVAKLAPFPPGVDSIDKAFTALGKVYAGNHRNGNVGTLECESAEANKVVAKMTSPYPNNFLYGVAYGIAKRYVPEGHTPIVQTDIQGNVCHFTITW